MLVSKQSRHSADQIIIKTLFPEATVQLTVNDEVVRASTVSGGGGAFVITLPSVAEAQGRFYSIYMVDRNSAEDITVEARLDDDQIGASGGLSDITLNLAKDRVLLYSDGYTWHTVTSSGV